MAKGNPRSNYPMAKLNPKCTPQEIGQGVAALDELRKLPPVRKRDPAGVRERLDFYFETCQERGLKPTVESMVLALGITRQAAWEWQQEGSEAGRLIERAKALINALLTQYAMDGKVAFPYVIWSQKNNFQYCDKVEVTAVPGKEELETQNLLDKLDSEGLVWDENLSEFIPEEGSDYH